MTNTEDWANLPQPPDPLNAARGILLGLLIALVLWAIPFGALWLWLAYWR